MRKAARTVLVLTAVLGLAAAGCGDDDNPAAPPGGGGTADVTVTIVSNAMNMGANAYSPDTAVIQVGQKIRWVNNDAMVHTATADPPGSSFNTGNIGAGAASNVITITGGTGVRAYHCAVGGHNMQGWVSVTP